jgi:hypothetical protein
MRSADGEVLSSRVPASHALTLSFSKGEGARDPAD